ncbi:hypothetical protein [Kushneria phosphatilytica]|uniref:Uncharacterized protein n=1 Tax=Kushneria phosphatilytica TaxID=657387 RepID=A0A1S1NWP2_9GAMM|nr:hypothetical protein [Kushneria phosphatilytica]OHV11982.1 hypothetical protein BH688_04735 [Kushneria phosphatilytica]QEL11168.1 hypothetical protein FY550_08485 [Kushneria phosphatilytica]
MSQSGLRERLSAERVSSLIGLLLVMLSAMPGYWLLGDHERLMLAISLCVGAAMLSLLLLWRMSSAQRQRLWRLGMQLMLCFVIGCAIMSIWSELSADIRQLPRWATMLPAGTTTGLLLHVVICWWRLPRDEA